MLSSRCQEKQHFVAHRTEEVTLSKFKHFTGQVGTDLEGQDASVRHSLFATGEAEQQHTSRSQNSPIQVPRGVRRKKKNRSTAGGLLANTEGKPQTPADQKEHNGCSAPDYCSGERNTGWNSLVFQKKLELFILGEIPCFSTVNK